MTLQKIQSNLVVLLILSIVCTAYPLFCNWTSSAHDQFYTGAADGSFSIQRPMVLLQAPLEYSQDLPPMLVDGQLFAVSKTNASQLLKYDLSHLLTDLEAPQSTVFASCPNPQPIAKLAQDSNGIYVLCSNKTFILFDMNGNQITNTSCPFWNVTDLIAVGGIDGQFGSRSAGVNFLGYEYDRGDRDHNSTISRAFGSYSMGGGGISGPTQQPIATDMRLTATYRGKDTIYLTSDANGQNYGIYFGNGQHSIATRNIGTASSPVTNPCDEHALLLIDKDAHLAYSARATFDPNSRDGRIALTVLPADNVAYIAASPSSDCGFGYSTINFTGVVTATANGKVTWFNTTQGYEKPPANYSIDVKKQLARAPIIDAAYNVFVVGTDNSVTGIDHTGNQFMQVLLSSITGDLTPIVCDNTMAFITPDSLVVLAEFPELIIPDALPAPTTKTFSFDLSAPQAMLQRDVFLASCSLNGTSVRIKSDDSTGLVTCLGEGHSDVSPLVGPYEVNLSFTWTKDQATTTTPTKSVMFVMLERLSPFCFDTTQNDNVFVTLMGVGLDYLVQQQKNYTCLVNGVAVQPTLANGELSCYLSKGSLNDTQLSIPFGLMWCDTPTKCYTLLNTLAIRWTQEQSCPGYQPPPPPTPSAAPYLPPTNAPHGAPVVVPVAPHAAPVPVPAEPAAGPRAAPTPADVPSAPTHHAPTSHEPASHNQPASHNEPRAHEPTYEPSHAPSADEDKAPAWYTKWYYPFSMAAVMAAFVAGVLAALFRVHRWHKLRKGDLLVESSYDKYGTATNDKEAEAI